MNRQKASDTGLALDEAELIPLGTTPPGRLRRRRDIVTREILQRDWLCIMAYFGGICIILACFGFTLWLARRSKPCQTWQVDPDGCAQDARIKTMLISERAMVQGIVTFINGLGLTAVSYSLYRLSQTVVWPVLQQQDMTMAQLDQYISASGGNVLPLVKTALRVRGQKLAGLSIFCCALLAALSSANSILVGRAYNLRSSLQKYDILVCEMAGLSGLSSKLSI